MSRFDDLTPQEKGRLIRTLADGGWLARVKPGNLMNYVANMYALGGDKDDNINDAGDSVYYGQQGTVGRWRHVK